MSALVFAFLLGRDDVVRLTGMTHNAPALRIPRGMVVRSFVVAVRSAGALLDAFDGTVIPNSVHLRCASRIRERASARDAGTERSSSAVVEFWVRRNTPAMSNKEFGLK